MMIVAVDRPGGTDIHTQVFSMVKDDHMVRLYTIHELVGQRTHRYYREGVTTRILHEMQS